MSAEYVDIAPELLGKPDPDAGQHHGRLQGGSMSMQVTKVWWDGEKLMAEPISADQVYKPEPVTEWLTCPKCSHKSPYSPIKAKTLAEDAERITKQARVALAADRKAQQEPVAGGREVFEQIHGRDNPAASFRKLDNGDYLCGITQSAWEGWRACATHHTEQQEPVAWCPDVCPITGLPFFMWIEHHETGQRVPTYGGPYDSYTIPVRDKDGSYCRERYDHDNGWWVTDEVEDVGVQIVSDQVFVCDDERPQTREPVGRTDQEIVDETEALAKWLMAWSFNHHPTTNAPIRQSEHPFAKSCWAAACHIQEMLTATDPENAVAELDEVAKCRHCHGIGYDASGYACSCTQEAA